MPVRIAAPVATAILAIVLALPSAARADTSYGVLIGGRPVDRAGNSGRLHDGHVYVDLVRITRALAGILTFDDADHSTLVTFGGHSVRFVAGSKRAEIDGAPVALRNAPFVANGDTFVPIEALATAAGATYTTDGHQKVVMLEPPATAPVVPVPAPAAS